jgi:hypothetical protein
MPNIRHYHESITSELDAVKNRIRNLVRHWPTDGEWREAALRTVLRRHLPDSSLVGRGFIVTRNHSSTQVDLFVLKSGKPTLFRDGDLVVITPDVPGAFKQGNDPVVSLTRVEPFSLTEHRAQPVSTPPLSSLQACALLSIDK